VSPVQVPLRGGLVALVSEEDAERVLAMTWGQAKTPNTTYAFHRVFERGELVYFIQMHRFVMDAPKGVLVDHINGDGLDNRRCNLRLATAQQNSCNRRINSNSRSGFRGVWKSSPNRFSAKINCGGKIIHLGTFLTAEEAARVRDEAAIKLHGEFASLNFPSREVAA
jgi:hypothetical protein